MNNVAQIFVTAIIAAVVVITLNAFILGSGFVGSLEKVSFSNVSSFYNDGNMNIIFDNAVTVGPGDFSNIWVDLDHVVVRVDSSLQGTAISASPKFLTRIMGADIFYRAQSVTVWVQDQQEKERWKNKEITYQKVLP